MIRAERKRYSGFILCTVLAAAAVAVLCTGGRTYTDVLRLHIIAEDDTPPAQEVKLVIRDAVLENCRDEFAGVKSAADAESTIGRKLKEIEALADGILGERGFDAKATAALGWETFPEREYDGEIYPAGRYRALCIRIGKAEGKNWWCVLFPPLCLLDTSIAPLDDGDELRANADGIVVKSWLQKLFSGELWK